MLRPLSLQIDRDMNQIKPSLICVASALALALPLAVQAAELKDLLPSEMNYAQQAIEQRCNEQAAAQDSEAQHSDTAYQACIKPYVDGMRELIAQQKDPAVTIALWSDCRRSSNF